MSVSLPRIAGGPLVDATPAEVAMASIWGELLRAGVEYPRPWASPEEGAMLLREEIDELWDEVRGNTVTAARAEAVQVGAMGLRFVCDLASTSPIRAWMTAWSHYDTVGPARLLSTTHEAFGFLQREYDALWAAPAAAEAPMRATGVTVMAARLIAEVLTPPAPKVAR